MAKTQDDLNDVKAGLEWNERTGNYEVVDAKVVEQSQFWPEGSNDRFMTDDGREWVDGNAVAEEYASVWREVHGVSNTED